MKATDIPEEARAALDGKPAQPQTFTAWMSNRTAEEQDQLFGRRNATRWRAGEISQAELLRQAGHEMSPGEFAAENG